MSIAASRCSPILKFPSELRGRDNVALPLLRCCRFRCRVPHTLPLVSARLCQPHLALPAGADDHMMHGAPPPWWICGRTRQVVAEGRRIQASYWMHMGYTTPELFFGRGLQNFLLDPKISGFEVKIFRIQNFQDMT